MLTLLVVKQHCPVAVAVLANWTCCAALLGAPVTFAFPVGRFDVLVSWALTGFFVKPNLVIEFWLGGAGKA